MAIASADVKKEKFKNALKIVRKAANVINTRLIIKANAIAAKMGNVIVQKIANAANAKLRRQNAIAAADVKKAKNANAIADVKMAASANANNPKNSDCLRKKKLNAIAKINLKF